jgi:biopolymer transport protein ExbD
MVKFTSFDKQISSNVNLTPLVDVVFILLIFFLLTSHIDKGIVIDLPPASSSESFSSDLFELAINADSSYSLNGIAIDPSKLKAILESAQKQAPNIQVIVLRADENASVRSFVIAMDSIRETGFYNLVIATSPTQTTKNSDESK